MATAKMPFGGKKAVPFNKASRPPAAKAVRKSSTSRKGK